MSYIHYQKMAILDFWPVRSFQGNHHCIEILLTLSEHNNSFGIIVFPEDLKFYEYFDLNHETTQGIIQKVLNSDGQFIVKFFEKYAEELFNLVEGAIKVEDALKGEDLKNYSDIKGNIELLPSDFFKWLPKKEYYVPSGLIKALDSGSVEEAEYLIEAFRQGFLYQFICERSGMTKRESREQLNENMKGFIKSGGKGTPIKKKSNQRQPQKDGAPKHMNKGGQPSPAKEKAIKKLKILFKKKIFKKILRETPQKELPYTQQILEAFIEDPGVVVDDNLVLKIKTSDEAFNQIFGTSPRNFIERWVPEALKEQEGV